jgi:hypothetical protein
MVFVMSQTAESTLKKTPFAAQMQIVNVLLANETRMQFLFITYSTELM